jgi:hypothetical protein
MENNKRELDFFNLLFPEALVIEIATQTNEYAQKQFDVGCIHSCMWSLFVQALAVHGPICHDQVLLEVDFWKCRQHENISSNFHILLSSDEEEIDSDDDTVLADIAKWSDHLRPIQIAEFTGPKPGPTTVMENNKRELDFFNLLFPEASPNHLAHLIAEHIFPLLP